MAIQTDFMVAVNQIAAERGLSADDIVESIKHAIRAGFKKDFPDDEGASLNIEIDEGSGTITVYADKKVVEVVTNEPTQISLKEAQGLEPKLRVGDHVEVDITPEGDFGRVAAQAAKQVILQKLRESEKDAQIQRFIGRVGEIETGVVQRMDGDSVIWELNKAVAVMPQEDRIPNEFYRSGSKHKVLLKEIRETSRGKSIVLSRSDSEFIIALFKLEIPELLSETIEIKSIAREAGQRSKVAVTSNVEGIDPIGACVGQRGARITAIMDELKMGRTEEKIDIILWDEDEAQFVVNALSPAQVITTKITDEKTKVIQVIVPDEQLSLAIGRDGQNVRLAAKLTGWNIDIQGETVKVDSDLSKSDDEAEEEATEEAESKPKKKAKTSKKSKKEEGGSEIEALGLSKRTVNALTKAGIDSVKDLKKKIKDEEKIAGVGPKAVEEIKAVI